jgi:curved DNA-binding protein CbpA
MIRWTHTTSSYPDRVTRLAAMTPRELLGVSTDATPAEVRSAYLRRVKSYHPDAAHPFMARHNEAVLKLINSAYEKLRAGA